uniref:Uncharacterized protein n=1 Tax=Arundo donax TaxID=35708 RepID=A0A0A9F0K1_ARUDO
MGGATSAWWRRWTRGSRTSRR